jgi:two-component system nitrogen regulation sensor histidine kinase GlnL
MNPAAEDLFGISYRRASELPLASIAPGIDALAELCDRAIQERQSFGKTLNIQSPQHEGGELELAVRVSHTGEDAASPLLVELFDITQRHQLDRENALLQQHGVSRRIIRELAHEIRNPLGGLRGAAQLLERELGDPSLLEFTQVIINEADRLAALMDNLLGPGSRPNKCMVSVHEVLERVAIVVESEWPEQKIIRDYDPSLPELWLDYDQMTQAFLNLVRNSAQATAGTGEIILRTRALINQVLNKQSHKLVAFVQIEDSGSGVPAEITETLFYPLVSGRADGTGLGLPLAQDLVNRHQGLIEYESQPGHTVFMVHLPIVESAGPADDPASAV